MTSAPMRRDARGSARSLVRRHPRPFLTRPQVKGRLHTTTPREGSHLPLPSPMMTASPLPGDIHRAPLRQQVRVGVEVGDGALAGDIHGLHCGELVGLRPIIVDGLVMPTQTGTRRSTGGAPWHVNSHIGPHSKMVPLLK